MLPVLSKSDHVTIGQPQDGFSRSENGSRACFPDSAQSQLYHCICGECTRYITSRLTFNQPRLAGRRACVYFKRRPAHASHCSSIVMQFATDVTSDTPWNIVAASINSTMFAPSWWHCFAKNTPREIGRRDFSLPRNNEILFRIREKGGETHVFHIQIYLAIDLKVFLSSFSKKINRFLKFLKLYCFLIKKYN